MGVLVRVVNDRRVGVLLFGGEVSHDDQGHNRSNISVKHNQRADAVDPHHGGRRVAHHGAGTAGIGSSDDGRQIANMHLALEKLVRHGATDQRSGNVIEEAGEHENHDQHQEATFPVCRQELGQDHRHVALFKMAGEQRKTGEQAEQVGNRHPFMTKMPGKTSHADTGLEAGKNDLVQADREQPGQRHVQRGMVKERHAEQGRCKQDEIDGNATHRRQVTGGKGRNGQ